MSEEQTTNPLVVSKDNWRGFSNSMHRWFLTRPGSRIGDLGSIYELGFLALEYGGESGEVLNEVKKMWRDGMSQERLDKIKGEVGDVKIMLHHICDALGLDDEECAATKISELHYRWPGWPFETVYNMYENGRQSDSYIRDCSSWFTKA